MTGITTFTVGRLRVHALEAGLQRLDGGAMFGIVPKPLWSRRIPADDRNRIPLALRCLLIEHDDGLVLVDSGIGNKENDKFRDIYGVDNGGANGRTRLEDLLAALGHTPGDVAVMLNTHLHFDHAGGDTFIAPDDPARRVQLSFPKARYVVHRREYEFATHTTERTQGSYLSHNFVPVAEAACFDWVEGESAMVVPGVRVMVTPGHVPWHQVVLVESDGETLCYPADTVPTAHHLPLAWIMGYDVEPMRTLESKRRLYAQATAERWRVVFEHDADTVGGVATAGERGVELAEAVPAPR